MFIDEDQSPFGDVRGGTLGFRPAGGGRPALRPRHATRTGAPAGDGSPRPRRARRPRYRRSAQATGVHGALIRALAARIGPSWRLLASEGQAWASATFVGERHRFVAEADPARLAGIAEWEFALTGHVVADIVVAAQDDARLLIEALTVAAA